MEGELFLIEVLIDQHTMRDTPLHIATRNGHRDAAELLLRHGANMNTRNTWSETPIDIAIRANNIELCRLFLSYGANPNNIMRYAIVSDHNVICEFLIDYGVDMNSAAHCMAMYGRSACTSLLLKHIDPDLIVYGISLLHIAVQEGNWHACDALIKHGADVNDGSNPPLLEMAYKKNQHDIVILLVNGGADVTIYNAMRRYRIRRMLQWHRWHPSPQSNYNDAIRRLYHPTDKHYMNDSSPYLCTPDK